MSTRVDVKETTLRSTMASYESRIRIGGSTLPVKTQGREGAPGDQSLYLFGNYLKAYINKYVGNAWRSTFLDESDPILTMINDDPYEGVSISDLPALYVYRQVFQGQSIQLGVDFEIIPSQITLVWIPSEEMDEERKIKSRFANLVSKAIYGAVQRGQDPVFQVEGFEHDEGTFIYNEKLMNVYSIRVSEGKWSKIDMYLGGDGQDSEARAQFPCLFVNINIEEMYERSITDDEELPDDEYDYNVGLDLTVNHGADITDVDRLITPPALT